MKRSARAIVLAPIVAYQRVISPALPQRCKYYPTCSAYAVDAIRELGVLRGAVLAAWRLLRCNPLSHGGYDPVEDRRPLRERPSTAPTDAPSRPEPRESGRGSEPSEASSRRKRERAGAEHFAGMIPLAHIFQPLINVANDVLVFFHDNVGLEWGLAIIALTFVTRIVILPLSIKPDPLDARPAGVRSRSSRRSRRGTRTTRSASSAR